MARLCAVLLVASWAGAAAADMAATGATDAGTAVTAAAAATAPNVAVQPLQGLSPGLRGLHVTNATVQGRRLEPWEETAPIIVTCNDGTTNTIPSCGEGSCDPVTGKCVCKDDWYTTDAAKPCNTEKKARITAILLHVFVGNFGTAPFYLGWTGYGVAMLLMCCLPCVCMCIVMCGAAGAGDEKGPMVAMCLPLFQALFGCASFGLWVAIIIFIANDKARDGDNVPLKL